MASTTSRYQESKDTQSNTKDGPSTKIKSMKELDSIIEMAQNIISQPNDTNNDLKLQNIIIDAKIAKLKYEQAS